MDPRHSRRLLVEGLPKDLDEETREKTLQRLEELANDRTSTDDKWGNWNNALEAFALGWRMPKKRFPVIISPESLVSTPQKLQEMAGKAEPPRVIDTEYTTMNGGIDKAHTQADGKPEKVQVGEVSWKELVEIQDKTEHEDFLFVFIEGQVRHTILVKSLKADSSDEGEQKPGDGCQGDN